MTHPGDRSRPVRLSDLPPAIADALTRPARPGEIEELQAQIAARRGEPIVDEQPPTEPDVVPAHLKHSILTPAERQQELDDRGRYQTLDEQIDEWLDDNGGTIPPDVLRDIVRRHREHLAYPMSGN
jgi:hypothetical protein